ncbi:hypothetical protein WJX81_000593 [Elliptochloris bilobata]|uniref:RING-type domain-containing protein n=1 Tax=Elliptochloris bilobata TaxID=381761 RepID=A0AAW1RLV2_9CHLO
MPDPADEGAAHALGARPEASGTEAVNAEDADMLLAKRLQEQEHAFAMLAGGSYTGSEGAPEGIKGEDLSGLDGLDDEATGILRLEKAGSYTGSEGEREGEEGEEGSDGEDLSGLEGLDDEALARRLQQREDRAHYRRLLELAGVGGGVEEEYEEQGEEDDDEEGYVTDDSVDPDNMTYEELQALGDAVGTVPRGVPQALIDALPLARFSAPVAAAAAAAPLPPPGGRVPLGLGSGLGPSIGAAAAAAAVEEEQCAVCRMEFEGGEDVRVLPCAHVYHPPCIEQWLLLNKACPICGKEVTAPRADPPPAAAPAPTPRGSSK